MQEHYSGETKKKKKKKLSCGELSLLTHVGAEGKTLKAFSRLVKRQALRADTLCQLDLWEFLCCTSSAHGIFH